MVTNNNIFTDDTIFNKYYNILINIFCLKEQSCIVIVINNNKKILKYDSVYGDCNFDFIYNDKSTINQDFVNLIKKNNQYDEIIALMQKTIIKNI